MPLKTEQELILMLKESVPDDAELNPYDFYKLGYSDGIDEIKHERRNSKNFIDLTGLKNIKKINLAISLENKGDENDCNECGETTDCDY